MSRRTADGDGATPEWVKSSYSSNDGPECVECAATPGAIRVRDSKDPAGPELGFAPGVWAAFVVYASRG
ncbi:DUF397 domain-containing protein [Streptomyces zhihengii]|uniref:DUF397 domain-containing protein n=1 Tax=Streptomyces zhihengii TaxID=1818004 RepID=A0ABS2UUG9_9ACTN|nr:DUF397 domain-containing protein [Streptomyces zhihengii]MBM9621211.1 DUF397 domain-containing protein [Streptomyces zhihengii]